LTNSKTFCKLTLEIKTITDTKTKEEPKMTNNELKVVIPQFKNNSDFNQIVYMSKFETNFKIRTPYETKISKDKKLYNYFKKMGVRVSEPFHS
jgi:hypothetical protein